MPDQSSLNLSTAKTGPVECLGQTFPSEEARREHFLKLLAAKLKEPAFRQIEGFPLGTDEAILALSDPPYYTACPNPWLGDFIKHYGTAYDPKKPYHREPFAADVSEGKTHPIYNVHSYHTKVPHRAIMRYILHYTQPGDIVFDGFCGTGMTGVAAQLCGDIHEVQELGYRVLDDGTILSEEGKAFSKIGARKTILNDLGPAATLIAYNHNTSADIDEFEVEAKVALEKLLQDIGWMFETNHLGGSKGIIDHVIWTDIFSCGNCGTEINLWNCSINKEKKEEYDEFPCPKCGVNQTKKTLERVWVKLYDPVLKRIRDFAKQEPALICYKVGKKKYEKIPDVNDLQIITKIRDEFSSVGVPICELPPGSNTDQPRRSHGFNYVHDFYTARNLSTIAALRRSSRNPLIQFWLNAANRYLSKMSKIGVTYYLHGGGGAINAGLLGTLYIPSFSVENNPFQTLKTRLSKLSEALRSMRTSSDNTLITTQSMASVSAEAESVDYLFIDPPFGANINYSELSYLWEAWTGVVTNTKSEAIQNKSQGKELEEYKQLMTLCLQKAYRVLKPGRWVTVEFSNTQASVWNAIQTSLQECGFVVANVSALDKQQRSFKAVTTTTAVKQDLVISAYKPNGGLELRFARNGQTVEGVWDFVRTHLKNLPITKAKGGQLEPIAERDPRILYDRMVAFYIGHSTPVPLSSGEFQAELQAQFPVRDGMVFLPEQVNIYDQKRVQMDSVGQLSIFVEDERSAIDWVRQFIKERPSTQQDIHPDFTQQLTASWKKWEARPELRVLLDQNFLCYDGVGEVPSQIHSYLSTQFKDLRNLDKDHAQLRHKAKDRWYVPDPKKNIDVETLRNKRLLEEFWLYLPEGYISAARNPDKAPTLPGMAAATPRPKVPRSKKLREVRTEAIRVGFKHCYQLKDYFTILAVADMLPESVLNEDEQLQMLYDNAALRSGTNVN